MSRRAMKRLLLSSTTFPTAIPCICSQNFSHPYSSLHRLLRPNVHSLVILLFLFIAHHDPSQAASADHLLPRQNNRHRQHLLAAAENSGSGSHRTASYNVQRAVVPQFEIVSLSASSLVVRMINAETVMRLEMRITVYDLDALREFRRSEFTAAHYKNQLFSFDGLTPDTWFAVRIEYRCLFANKERRSNDSAGANDNNYGNELISRHQQHQLYAVSRLSDFPTKQEFIVQTAKSDYDSRTAGIRLTSWPEGVNNGHSNHSKGGYELVTEEMNQQRRAGSLLRFLGISLVPAASIAATEHVLRKPDSRVREGGLTSSGNGNLHNTFSDNENNSNKVVLEFETRFPLRPKVHTLIVSELLCFRGMLRPPASEVHRAKFGVTFDLTRVFPATAMQTTASNTNANKPMNEIGLDSLHHLDDSGFAQTRLAEAECRRYCIFPYIRAEIIDGGQQTFRAEELCGDLPPTGGANENWREARKQSKDRNKLWMAPESDAESKSGRRKFISAYMEGVVRSGKEDWEKRYGQREAEDAWHGRNAASRGRLEIVMILMLLATLISSTLI